MLLLDVHLACSPSPAWYHVSNLEMAYGSPTTSASCSQYLPSWPPSGIHGRSKNTSCTYILYTENKRTSPVVVAAVQTAQPSVLLLDNTKHNGLSAYILDLCCLSVVRYGRGKRHVVPGLRGRDIPRWSATLLAVFTNLLTAAAQGPRTTYWDVWVALGHNAAPPSVANRVSD